MCNKCHITCSFDSLISGLPSNCDNDHTQIHAIPYSGSEPLGFDMTFAHGPTIHFPHYIGQSGSSHCSSTPTNAKYKNCKHSTTRLVFSLVFSL